MKIKKILLLLFFLLNFSACANYEVRKTEQKDVKKYHTSSGFVLIYEDSLYDNKIVSKKLNNDDLLVMHSFLKRNTLIKIINPYNSKVVKTKIYKKANYPKIFNMVVSKKIASILELDIDNPFVEIFEIKKNKTFVAKERNIFEVEKNVIDKVPVDEITINDLTTNKPKTTKKKIKKNNFVLVISDFYYIDSANNLMNELIKKININNISVKKIKSNKYRLLVGPFENFNALKMTYISLNNLGFEGLNVYNK